MLIYSIATNKSVGDRIDGLTKTVSDNIKGRLDKYIVDEEGFAQKTEFRNQEIERLEKSKDGKTESEISSINSFLTLIKRLSTISS